MNTNNMWEFIVFLVRRLMNVIFPYGLLFGLVCGIVLVVFDHFDKAAFGNYVLGGSS